MEVFRGLESFAGRQAACLTVGSFDGIHLGHQRILRMMRKSGESITVLTFDPHPQTIVRPNDPPPPQLTNTLERIELFETYGVKQLIFVRFDASFAALSSEDYVRDVLTEQLKIRNLFVGPNHRFGQGRAGDVTLLRRLGERHGFAVTVVDPIHRQGEPVSSSRIRKRLEAGDAVTALKYLGRPYYIQGEVVKGKQRGRALGFPTANFAAWEVGKLQPPPGIYATIAEFDGVRYPSVSHFGPRPTFAGDTAAIETHIIGFDRMIYGETIRVGLVDRIRGIVAFETVSALVRQMEVDRHEALTRIDRAGYKPEARSRDRKLG